MMFLRVLILTAAFSASTAALAENIVFPPDANVADVTKPPYNADKEASQNKYYKWR